MAQSGYTPIQLYYSTTASAVPTAANLLPGELALNINDGKMYYEDSGGVVRLLATSPTSPQVIDVNSASAALRITQTGAGDALLVEDSANPDSTPYVINNAGQVAIGATTVTAGTALDIQRPLTGAVTAYSIVAAINPDVTVSTNAVGVSTLASSGVGTSTTSFTHFNAAQGSLLGTTPTNQYGYAVQSSLTGATNNYGFYSNIASGANRFNFYANGTASNFFGGEVIVNGAVGIGSVGSPSYGTSGQVLTSQGPGVAPQWASPTGGVTVGKAIAFAMIFGG